MKYLELATKIALGTIDEHKNSFFAAIATRKDGAMVVSTNIRTKLPEQAAHCEARLIKKCDAGATIYLVRVLRGSKEWAMSKPCAHCAALIRNRRIKRVYYSIAANEYAVWDP